MHEKHPGTSTITTATTTTVLLVGLSYAKYLLAREMNFLLLIYWKCIEG